jgi:hypothetical protein
MGFSSLKSFISWCVFFFLGLEGNSECFSGSEYEDRFSTWSPSVLSKPYPSLSLRLGVRLPPHSAQSDTRSGTKNIHRRSSHSSLCFKERGKIQQVLSKFRVPIVKVDKRVRIGKKWAFTRLLKGGKYSSQFICHLPLLLSFSPYQGKEKRKH